MIRVVVRGGTRTRWKPTSGEEIGVGAPDRPGCNDTKEVTSQEIDWR